MGSIFGSRRSRDAVRMIRVKLWSRLRAVFRRAQVESELMEELELHLELQTRKHQRAGLPAAEARVRARREFGNLELAKEDARDVRGTRPLEDLVADVKYGVRGLARSPGFSLAVVLTIGLGVGLNTSAFTILNAYVLRPFEIRDPSSLYSVQWLDRSGHVHDFTTRDVEQLRSSPVLADASSYLTFSARLAAAPATGDAVDGHYFGMVGVRPALGRVFGQGDATESVLVLSHSAWRNWFGGDTGIVGRIVLVRGAPFHIIGVAQSGFEGLFKKPRDFWVPLAAIVRFDTSAAARPAVARPTLVRLAPNTSAAQARSFIGTVLRNNTASLVDSSRFARLFLTSRASAIAPSVGTFLAFAPLLLAFALILVLACVNVANMLLARGVARQRELGTRLALGADRSRLVRQLVTEAIVLALPAVGVGFAVAGALVELGVRVLFATLPADLTGFVRLVPLHLDVRVLAFALAASLGAALLFGLMPALQTTRLSVVEAIRGDFASVTPRRIRGALVMGQVIAASLLLAVAGLLLREAQRLGRIETGIRTRGILSLEVPDKTRDAVLSVLRGSQMIESVSGAAALPLDMKFPTAVVQGDDVAQQTVMYNRVSGSYFSLLGIQLVAGRGFTAQEEQDAARVVIVSETAAHRLWAGESPLGRVVRFALAKPASNPLGRYQNAVVVGVARNVVVNSVEDGRDRTVFYLPQPLEASGCCVLARVRGNAAVAKRAVSDEIERMVPGAVERVDLLDSFVAGAVYPYRAAYWVAIGLGLLALGLTVIGVYGVISYIASQRAREIGVRIALGARTRDVLRLIMSQSLRQASLGACVGCVLAAAVGRVLSSSIRTVPAFDGVACVGAFCVVVLACAIAAFVPCWRAARLDPTAALRQD